MTASHLHIVVTCANRKRHDVPTELRLRDIRERTAEMRFGAWQDRLESSHAERYPAIELYAGEHWSVVRELTGSSPLAQTAQLWIMSAGYGLIPANALIRPYAATFSAASADSV